MDLGFEIRRRAKLAVAPVLCAGVIGYFGYHAVEGQRGLLAWGKLTKQVAEAEAELDVLRRERLVLERRVSLLSPDGLDLDLLEERARHVLGYARPDEVIIYDKP